MKKFSPIKIIIIFLALTFVIHQLVSIFYKPISTESAYFHTASKGFDVTGIIIRNESLVKTDKDGVLHFITPDGNRVAKNGVIANIYQNEDASITLSHIDTIKKKIDDIEDIISQNNVQAGNLDVANHNVDSKLNELVLSSSFGDFNNVQEQCEELLTSLNRRKALLGETADFSAQLSSLNAELKSLESSLSNPIGKITSNESGYFISKTDGYEQTFDISDLSKITPEFLSNLSKQKFSDNVVGKIVSDYEWYIAAKVSLDQSLNFKEGDSLTIHTTVKASPDLPVKVKKINLSSDGTDAVILFSCSSMNSELATMRSGAMKVIKQEYSGLRVPKKALRVVDGKKGVYVVSGMQVKFVPIEIVFTGDDFILCKKTDVDGDLRLYDQVVVKGKNLYDGKIIG